MPGATRRRVLYRVIDTHCHLTFPELSGDVAGLLREARAAGVDGAITISTTTFDCLDAMAVASAHEHVYCTAGVHPLYADSGRRRTDAGSGKELGGPDGHEWANMGVVAAHPKCVAWGELGLDNHYPEPAREVQLRVLETQLARIEAFELALGVSKPVVVHCRKAFTELLAVLRGVGRDGSKYVFHCFTAGPDEMRRVLDFGASVSFTGVVTYSNAPEVREAAKLVPGDRIMVETDAPYLSPEPRRSRRPCVPALVRHTAEALAAVRGVAFEEFHAQINENTARFFGVRGADDPERGRGMTRAAADGVWGGG